MSDDHDEPRLGERDEPDEEPAPRLCVTLWLRGAYENSVASKALRQAGQESRDSET